MISLSFVSLLALDFKLNHSYLMALLCVSMLVVSSRSMWIQCSWGMLNEQPRRIDLGWYFSMGRKVSVLLQYGLLRRPPNVQASDCICLKNLILPLTGSESSPNGHLSFGFSLLCLPKVMFLWSVGLLCGNWNHSFYIYHKTALRGCAFQSQPSQAWTESKNDSNSPPLSCNTNTLHYVKLTLPLPI